MRNFKKSLTLLFYVRKDTSFASNYQEIKKFFRFVSIKFCLLAFNAYFCTGKI